MGALPCPGFSKPLMMAQSTAFTKYTGTDELLENPLTGWASPQRMHTRAKVGQLTTRTSAAIEAPIPMPKNAKQKTKPQTAAAASWPTVVLALKGLNSDRIDGTGPPGLGSSEPLSVLQRQGWRVVQIVSVQGAPGGITAYVVLAAP